jgi:WD40 repeat protein
MVGIWTVPGFELLQALRCHATAVFPPRFSPDGRLMVTHGLDREVRVWNTVDWSYSGGINLPRNGALSVAYGPDPSQLIAASGSTIWGMDPTRRSVEWVTELEDVAVSSVAVSPSGEVAALGTEDGRVVLVS